MFWRSYAKPKALMPYYIAEEFVNIERVASIWEAYLAGELSRRGL